MLFFTQQDIRAFFKRPVLRSKWKIFSKKSTHITAQTFLNESKKCGLISKWCKQGFFFSFGLKWWTRRQSLLWKNGNFKFLHMNYVVQMDRWSKVVSIQVKQFFFVNFSEFSVSLTSLTNQPQQPWIIYFSSFLFLIYILITILLHDKKLIFLSAFVVTVLFMFYSFLN